MLGKLLKYELKRSARKFFPFAIGYLIISLILSLLITTSIANYDRNFIFPLIVVGLPYIVCTAAIFILGFVISLASFNKTLFTDEGYLMLTIPVKPYYHIITKLISSVIWSAASLGFFAVSLLILDPEEFTGYLGDFVDEAVESMVQDPLMVVLVCLYFLVLFANLQVFFYFVISLANSFRHKILAGFAIVFGCNVISSIISSFVGNYSLWNLIFVVDTNFADIDYHLRTLFMIIYQLVYAVIFYFLTNYIITRNHNLQ